MTTVSDRAVATAPDRGASRRPLAGTGVLVRFILRRDRIRLPVWVGAITLFSVWSVAVLPEIYVSESDRQARAELMQNPGTRAISGPGYGLDDYTFGAMIAHEYLSWVAIFVALMSILLMVRHTRTEEETGRAELIRAAVVGRHAHTTAALLVVTGANVLVGALLALGLGSLGLESVTMGSSLLFGAALAAIGMVFAAVTAVAAQVNEHGRGVGGLAGAVFGLAYLLRAAGDMTETGGGVLSWLSPIGWAQQTRVYVDDRWWPLLLPAVLTIALGVAAYWLSTRRDVGAAMVRPRPGAATASNLLSSSFGLAVRLHRASVVWWSVALFLFAFGYGSLASEVETFAADFSAVENIVDLMGGESIIDAWLALISSLFGITVAVFATLTVLRLRSEETSGRAEPVLAAATSRTGWVISHVAIALAGSVGMLFLSGLGLGLTASAVLGDASVLPELVGAVLAYAPAVWLVVGLGVALFGVVPRASSLVWIVIVYAGLIGSFSVILDLPAWTLDLSPFSHIPALPAADMAWAPILILSLLAAGLTYIGVMGFRRRDLDLK